MNDSLELHIYSDFGRILTPMIIVHYDEIFLIHNKLGIIFCNNIGFGILNYPNFIQKNKYFKTIIKT